jgi:hypothetical protein
VVGHYLGRNRQGAVRAAMVCGTNEKGDTTMNRLLRLALTADSVACGVMGGGTALAAAALDGPLGIPAGWLVGLGVVLVGAAVVLGRVATRPEIPAAAARLVIVGNLAWVAASVVAVVAGVWSLTAAGTVVVLAQAVAVLALVDLEYVGLRRQATEARMVR